MYRKSALLGFALVMSIFALSTPSRAIEYDVGTSCMKQGELLSFLYDAHHETWFANGRLANGRPIEVYMSKAGSWTMVEFIDDGYGCIHSSDHEELTERLGNHEGPRS